MIEPPVAVAKRPGQRGPGAVERRRGRRVSAHAAMTGAARRRLRRAAIPPVMVGGRQQVRLGSVDDRPDHGERSGPGGRCQNLGLEVDGERTGGGGQGAAGAGAARRRVADVAMGATRTVKPAARRASARPVDVDGSMSTPTGESSTPTGIGDDQVPGGQPGAQRPGHAGHDRAEERGACVPVGPPAAARSATMAREERAA